MFFQFAARPAALLPLATESLWNDATVPTPYLWDNQRPSSTGVTVGVLFTTTVIGEISAIRYYRTTDAFYQRASSGTVALWQITGGGLNGTLLASVDFSGHSGTGWRQIELPESLTLSSSHGYVAGVWFPSADGTNTNMNYTPYTFLAAGAFSSPWQLIYAEHNSGVDDPRGFFTRNGLYADGPLQCPYLSFVGENQWIDLVYTARPRIVPPDQPMILKWDIPPGMPTWDNTGPDPATVFTTINATVNSTANDEIIEDLIINGQLGISHTGVTVRNCIINHPTRPINVAIGADNLTVEDCIIDGGGKNNLGSNGIYMPSIGGTIQRCDIRRLENGISLGGTYPLVSNTVIRDNFIHHERATPGYPHYDCIQMDGGQQGVLIEHNTIMNEQTDTSAVMLDNLFGNVDDITVRDNLMCGAGYVCWIDGEQDTTIGYTMTNINYVDNQMHVGYYGYLIGRGHDVATTVIAGNQLMSHGGIFQSPPSGGFTEGQLVAETFFNYALDTPGGPSSVPVASGGITIGVGFQIGSQAGQITGLNFRRPNATSTDEVQIGLWRFTGSDLTGGTELLGSRTFTGDLRTGQIGYLFDTPIDVEAGDNLVVGAYIPRGSDGSVWFFQRPSVFWPDPTPSEYGRFTAYSNQTTPVPLNGFSGQNGLYTYAGGMAAPITSGGINDVDFCVDPVFVAPWEV